MAAERFAKANLHLVNLSQAQEKKLLLHIVPRYEKMVKNALRHVNLLQHEFDALVSFAYNSGGKFKAVTDFIKQGKTKDAMATIRSANVSKGQIMQALVSRRDNEVALYLFNNYGKFRIS